MVMLGGEWSATEARQWRTIWTRVMLPAHPAQGMHQLCFQGRPGETSGGMRACWREMGECLPQLLSRLSGLLQRSPGLLALCLQGEPMWLLLLPAAETFLLGSHFVGHLHETCVNLPQGGSVPCEQPQALPGLCAHPGPKVETDNLCVC